MPVYPPRTRLRLLTDPLFLLGLLALTALLAVTLSQALRSSSASPSWSPDWGNVPLSFVSNAGQTEPQVRFQSNALGGTLFFTDGGVVLVLPATTDPSLRSGQAGRPTTANGQDVTVGKQVVVRLEFEGANSSPGVVGDAPLRGVANFFRGGDAGAWQRDVPTYGSIRYEALYPGIALQYEGAGTQLKGTYLVAPGADPAVIRWRYEGVAGAQVDAATGTLRLALPAGGEAAFLTEGAPVAWQEKDGERVAVAAQYAVAADGSIGFSLGAYDAALPLTIDPTLSYSRFLGGSFFDGGSDIAVDGDGNSYLVGYTSSADFPAANGATRGVQTLTRDVVVVKLDPTGTDVLYSTVFGGAGFEQGTGIVIDAAGNAFVTGYTASFDDPLSSGDESFPTANPLQAERSGPFDAFVARLDAGGALAFSSYLGGDNGDYSTGIALDGDGLVYLTGYTESTNFPVTAGAAQGSRGSLWDGFVAKVDTSTSSLTYGTYLGGTDDDYGMGIAVDGGGNAYITGHTRSGDFPGVAGLQGLAAADDDAFVVKVAPTGTAFLYSRLLAGTDDDYGAGIAVDTDGNAYLTGYTQSDDFPTLSAAYDSPGGGDDAFATKLDAAGTTLYSTYLGGSGYDEGVAVAVDPFGTAHIVGFTSSDDFPTQEATQDNNGGATDGFVARLTPNGTGLSYSSYLGGAGEDYAQGVAADMAGSSYLTGYTRSASFDAALRGLGTSQDDLFAAKIGEAVPTALTLGGLEAASGAQGWLAGVVIMAVVLGFMAIGRMNHARVAAREEGARE